MNGESAPKRRGGGFSGAGLSFPAAILTLAVMIGPFLILVRDSFNRFDPVNAMQTAFTLRNYVAFAADPYYRAVLATTLFIAAVSTALALLVGFPAAYVMARSSDRAKRLYTVLIVLPLLIGSVVRGAGWMIILGRAGVINAVLLKAGAVKAPLEMLYSPFAVVVATLAAVLPYLILSLQSVLEGIDIDLEEAAQNLGAGRATRFVRVIAPLAAPGVAAGTMLVFILCMNAYATPVLLGGPRTTMMAPSVYDQFAKASNWPFGSAMALILVAVTLITSLLANALIHGRYARTMLSNAD